jgi:hypothetical protein
MLGTTLKQGFIAMKKTTTDSIPTKKSISPDYAGLTERRTALHAEQHTLRGEARTLDAAIRASVPLSTRREARAAQILDGASVVEPTAEDRLSIVMQRLGDLDVAIEMIEEKIDVEDRRASGLIVARLADVHKKLVADICVNLIAAHAANKNYHDLIDKLHSDDVRWTGLSPMQPNSILGQPRDNYSNIALYLREAAANGFIEVARVPVELRA